MSDLTAGPAIPILRSFDETATRAFYLDFLGFEVLFEHRFSPEAPLYLAVRLGACELHLSEHYGDVTPGGAVRIQVPDARALSEALVAKKYKYAAPGVQEAPWADEVSVRDPNGNRLVFYTPRAD